MPALKQRATRAMRKKVWLGAALGRRVLGGCVLAGCVLGGCALQPARAPAPAPAATSRAPTAPVIFVGRNVSGTSSSESALDDRLGSIEARLEALAASVMVFWKAHGPDTEQGGIHGRHDRRGQPKLDADKGLVQQARHLWS